MCYLVTVLGDRVGRNSTAVWSGFCMLAGLYAATPLVGEGTWDCDLDQVKDKAGNDE